jgi:hypothetical protein
MQIFFVMIVMLIELALKWMWTFCLLVSLWVSHTYPRLPLHMPLPHPALVYVEELLFVTVVVAVLVAPL